MSDRISRRAGVGAILVLALFLPPVPSRAGEKCWMGYVTLEERTFYEKVEKKTKNGRNESKNDRLEVNEGIFIQTCACKGSTWAQATGSYAATARYDDDWAKEYEFCEDKTTRRSRRVAPGYGETSRMEEHAEKVADGPARVDLVVDDDHYHLVARGDVVARGSGKIEVWVKDACAGSRRQIRDQPLAGGDSAHPLSWSVSRTRVPGSVIRGEETERLPAPRDSGQGKFERVKSASWFLTDDACAYVRNEIEAATHARMLYGSVLERAAQGGMDGDEFNRMVKEESGPTASPMGTDATTCAWVPGEREDGRAGLELEDIRSKYYRCLPDVVFESDVAHEESHQRTCREWNKCSRRGDGSMSCESSQGYGSYMESPGNYAHDEVPAYDTKILVLQDWLKAHCD